MRAIGRGVAATVLAGCVALTGTSRGLAETFDEQPIAVPEQESAPAPTDVATTGAETIGVRDVRVETTDTGRRVIVALTREPDSVQNFQLTAPPRVVVDVRGPHAGRAHEGRFAVTDRAVSRVRVAPYEGQLRIVLDLTSKGAVTGVYKEGSTVVADLAPLPAPKTADAAPARKSAAATVIGESTEAADPVSQPVLAAMVETAPAPAPTPEPTAAPTPAAAPSPAAAPARAPEPTPVAVPLPARRASARR
jgi:hypothetical protein